MKNLIILKFILLLLTSISSVSAANTSKDMVLIKKGCFMMGTDKIYDYLAFGERPNDRERPVHSVCLDSFYLEYCYNIEYNKF